MPASAKPPKPPPRPRGRPKKFDDDMLVRYHQRVSPSEYDLWAAYAKAHGHSYADEGQPGPIVRDLMLAYVADERVRTAVTRYYEAGHQLR